MGVPDKFVSILKAMHKNVEVLFEVDGVKKKLNSIIGVKQGDLLGPELFTFYMRVHVQFSKPGEIAALL